MTVNCERCAATFRVDPSIIGPDGANVRCGKCGYVFFIKKDGENVTRSPKVTQSSAPKKEDSLLSSLTNQFAVASEGRPETPPTPPQKSSPPPTPAPKSPPPPIPKATPSEPAAPIPSSPEKRLPTTPPPLQKRETLSHQSLGGRPLPMQQQIKRASVVALMVLLGVLFGLLAMGVKPLPEDLSLLIQYGKRSVPKTVQILSYQGQMQDISPTERVFRITGQIFNHSDQDVAAPALRMEVFSPRGEFLMKKTFPCCSDRVGADTIVPFSTQIHLGQTSTVGSYKVSLEK